MSSNYPPPGGRASSQQPAGGSIPPGGTARFPVAFIGTGAMGTPMATNIARKGFPLSVWNRTHEKAGSLITLGAKQRSTPRECVVGARVIVTMLSDENALFDVLCRADGVLEGLEPDAVVVDMSTIGRAGALKAAEFVKQRAGKFIDAPVSGSIGPATSGELVALVGGRLNDVTRAQPVLLAMCKRLIHAGDVGQGQALKVILNGIGAHLLAAYTSMLVLGERVGIPRRTLIEAIASGAFSSPSFLGKKDRLMAKDYSPEFALDLSLKDAKLNIELQQEVGLPLPAHREITRAIEKAIEDGLGAEDLFALEKYYRSL